ncbi:hypothetical protein Ctob_013142 [Chrysochromulina tobinii]|uniref:PDZ domain-containing protein n=1 Tax=Chrysochromulina tobinii TaxID=1460289 RepID=A0A0M0K0T3_9EUKA|nr:hypothetical protein Ctob_013142 [Chrysochromulina tobinii]|eukprot:KOO32471.1 hypothetical protein Ctob_013142 [Chrysochromulina sp. CCMP291]
MTDSDSESDEFDLPPMISLEDLVGPSNAEVVATTRVIFPRCDATPAELAAVESHLRRCLAYPVIAYAPAFEGRCELLLAILDELRRNDSNTGDDPAPPEPLGEEAPEENFAGRVALADLEASLSECRDQERFSRIGGSRSALAASLRWRRRAAALEALRKPLRERLGIKDLPPKAAPTRQLALKSASTAAAHTGGAQSFSVLRSLSFERKKKEAVVSSDGGSGRGASGGGEDGGGGKSFSILRSLSFERKKKEADAAGTSKQSKQKQAMLRAAAAKGGGAAGGSTVTKSKVLLAAWASTHGKFGAMTKVKLEITESQVLYERHEIDLAAVEGAWAHQAGYCTVSIKFTHKPKPKVFMLEQSDACEKAEDSSAHEAAHDLGGAGGAGAQSSGGARRKRFGTKADLALQSAAAASPSQLRGRLSTWEEGEGGARYGALGDGAGADEADEDSTVAVGRAELSCYSACLSALSGYVSARLPTLIAERDEMVAEAEEGGGGAEHGVAEGAKCAELLVHLLSLSHRLTPAEDTGRVSYRDMHDERGDEWQVKEGSEASGVGGGERFVWQSKVCPPSLAASSRSALRAAATLMTEQEMRAASQTRRPKALTASGASEKTKKGDRPKASQAADVRDEVWTHWVRLKRLRVRLQRALPLQLSLLSGVVGGPGALVQVWAEALHFAVLEPLHMLGESLPVDMALVEVLSMALEHRRIVMLLQATAAGGVAANAAAAFLDDDAEGGGEGGGEGGEARSPALSASPSSGMGDGVGDELMLIGDRMWYSPFVFEWLRVASRHIESWVNEALDDETNWRHWRPVGPGRHSRTLILLFRACFTMVNSLRRLDVVVCGEAVSAAQGIADHHATFAAVLAKAATAASASAPPPAATGKDRTVVANKAAGAEPLLGVQGVARGLLRGTDVLITYVQPTSVLATLIHPGERVLSVNGEAVTSAAQALRLLKTASQLRVKVQAPPGLEEVGSDARRQLQTLASTIEETLHSSTEQSSIVSACFVEVFGALRRTSDEQISVLADKLLRPVRAHIAKLGAPATPSGTLLGTKAGGASEFNLVQARTLDRLCRWLAPEAVQRLLQRLWTDVLSDLLEALRKQLYTPRELGDSFVKGAIQLMRDFAAVLLDATDGPTKRWLTQRATPLQATLALTELPTAALLQQYRIRPTGPTRAAPLVALALRLDDREAASVVMEQPAELAEGQALNVDGRPALEAYRTLEPLV